MRKFEQIKIMKNLFNVLLLGLLFLSCNGQTDGVETITAKTFAEKIKTTPDAQILDVRTPEEYSSEHIDKANNVNWNDDNFVDQAKAFDKSKPVFVYCKSGGRSAQAAAKLAAMGFTQIYNLDGGMMKWNAAGLSKPSEKLIGMSTQAFAELIKSDEKVLVSFYADWCAPCKKMAPYMSNLQKEYTGKLKVVRLNADENKTLIAEMKMDELPVLLLYNNGQITWQHKGYISESDLKKQLP